jgi:lipoprotein NlpI
MDARPGDLSATFLRGNARLQSGNPEGAVQDFTAVLRRRPNDTDALMARAIARQYTGEFDAAEADFTAILERVSDAAQPLANRGYVRMMKGDFEGATKDLSIAMTLPDAPAELTVWRFVAEARAGHKATDVLKATADTLTADSWPAPLLHYFLGRLSGDQLLMAAAKDASEAKGRACEAYYFLGQAALLSKDARQATKLFQAALATGMTRHTEYLAAKAELARLGLRP